MAATTPGHRRTAFPPRARWLETARRGAHALPTLRPEQHHVTVLAPAHDREGRLARVDNPVVADADLMVEAQLLDGVVRRVARRENLTDPVRFHLHGCTRGLLGAALATPAEHIGAHYVAAFERNLDLRGDPPTSRPPLPALRRKAGAMALSTPTASPCSPLGLAFRTSSPPISS